MILKTGVRIAGIKPEAVVAMMVCEGAYRSLGYEMVVTSCVEGQHSRGSIHYVGMAFDLRISHLRPESVPIIVAKIKEQLGGDFDVVLESDHIHCEYEPKEPL
jgi:hypothetical protein